MTRHCHRTVNDVYGLKCRICANTEYDTTAEYNCIDHLAVCQECKVEQIYRHKARCVACGRTLENDQYTLESDANHLCKGFALCPDCYKRLFVEATRDVLSKYELKHSIDKFIETLKQQKRLEDKYNEKT